MNGGTRPELPWSARRHEEHREDRERQAEYPFHVDRDRIIHSGTFRELQHKTQVQSIRFAGTDRPFRTRLNHVLEVAQIARGLASDLDATEPLAEGIALAHDLGHTPFGHAGERGLSNALVAAGHPEGFNANVHSLMVVDDVECAFAEFRGLNLTWATREGIARHATPFDEPVLFGEFTERANAGIEAQIVDLADPLAYISHDLDDAIAADLIDLEVLADISPLLAELMDFAEPASVWPAEYHGLLKRRRLVARLLSRMIRDIVEATREQAERARVETAADVRDHPERIVRQSAGWSELTLEVLHLLKTCYYRSDDVQRADADAIETITGLFEALVERPDAIPSRFVGEDVAMRAATYIASLNDISARDLAEKLGVNSEPPLATAPN